MKTLSNTSGNYGMLQGDDGVGDLRVFGLAATVAVLVVTAVVAFKMAGPEIKTTLMSYLPVVAQQTLAAHASVSAPRADAPARALVIGEH